MRSNKTWSGPLTDAGRWKDNLYNFLLLTLRKLLFTLPSEGKLQSVVRRDGGPLHEVVREAMTNSITYCDYLLGGVLRIDRRTDRIVMRNPGTLRIPPERIYNGDYTQARNATIQKMLRMVGFGDNIGSGFQKIMKAWHSLGYGNPEIHEEDDVNEVWLILPLTLLKNVTDKTGNVTDKTGNVTNNRENVTDKTGNVTKSQIRRKAILDILKSNCDTTTQQIAEQLHVSKRTILRDIEVLTNSNIIKGKAVPLVANGSLTLNDPSYHCRAVKYNFGFVK